MDELTDKVIPGIPDQLLAVVGVLTKKLTGSDLATFILVGTAGWKLDKSRNGYENTKHLAESDGTIRDDILQCVMWWANRRQSLVEATKLDMADY